jgi:hypothetical protein
LADDAGAGIIVDPSHRAGIGMRISVNRNSRQRIAVHHQRSAFVIGKISNYFANILKNLQKPVISDRCIYSHELVASGHKRSKKFVVRFSPLGMICRSLESIYG